jgi:hypothetical protein
MDIQSLVETETADDAIEHAKAVVQTTALACSIVSFAASVLTD